jgi:hypothetical protein
MPRIITELGRKLSRIFLGRIIVRDMGSLLREAPLSVMTHTRKIDVKPLRAAARVGSALFVKWRGAGIKSAGLLPDPHASKKFKPHKISFRKIKHCEVRYFRFALKRKAAARKAMSRINRAPSMRHNRLGFLKNQPKFGHAALLALYSPLFQEKVVKSALDKSSGNLLFWYDNERVKIGDRYHLLLLRVFGGKEPLKWLWLPVGRKID